MMEVPDGWRRPHPKQPLDGPDRAVAMTIDPGSSLVRSLTLFTLLPTLQVTRTEGVTRQPSRALHIIIHIYIELSYFTALGRGL